MRKAQIIVAFFFVAVGIVVIVDAVRVGFGWGPSGPESGFFPFYLGVGTLICSALVLIKGFKESTPENSKPPWRGSGASSSRRRVASPRSGCASWRPRPGGSPGRPV